MADLCIWQASGPAGIHNASLYISLRNGEELTSKKILNSSFVPLSARWEIELNSKQIAYSLLSLPLSLILVLPYLQGLFFFLY
jgi:hypothetical protein